MNEFEKAMVTIVERKDFIISEAENKMLPLIREEIRDFATNIHEIIQDNTEDQRIGIVLHAYMVRELACILADINFPNDLT